ncbi:GNAT family N-acetyltransferase [Tianweitania sediminis]|uniref:GNAT family N-acetyltransferase n=1 Tax=Tianweitania sediminis TaxID=1502156 RepID=UPI00360DE1CF
MRETGCERTLFSTLAPCTSADPATVQTVLERAGITQLYPNFEDWFLRKVVPGIRAGERCIMTSFIEGLLVGVAICKRTEVERKLCTLWVSPQARRRGVASELASSAFSWLGTNQPLFTVPEERLCEFDRLLQSWSFPKPVIYKDLYRSDRAEYVFNEHLDTVCH